MAIDVTLIIKFACNKRSLTIQAIAPTQIFLLSDIEF